LTLFKKYKIKSVVNAISFCHGYGATPQDRFLTTVVSAFNLLEAARIFEVDRFIEIVTTGVYPMKHFYEGKWKGKYEPVTEEHPVGSATTNVSDYHSTKIFTESLGVRYRNVYGLKFFSLRPSTTYGPGRRIWRHWPGNYTKVIMDAAEGRATHFDVGGDDEYDPLYVRDFAEAVAVMHQHPNPSFHTYNVARSEPITFSHFLSIVNEATGLHCSAGPGKFPPPPGDQGRFSNERITKDLGWHPRYSTRDAVAEYVDYLRGGELK
jgi:nucleoside-diphosphate-sugar epimerase